MRISFTCCACCIIYALRQHEGRGWRAGPQLEARGLGRGDGPGAMSSSDDSDSDGFDSCSETFDDARSGAPDPSSAGRGGKVDGDDDEAGSEGFETPDEFEDARSVLSDVSSSPLDTRAAAGTPPASDDLAAADDERASSRGSASGTTSPNGRARPPGKVDPPYRVYDPWATAIRDSDRARTTTTTTTEATTEAPAGGRRLSRDGSFEWRHHREFSPLPTVESAKSLHLSGGDSGSSVDNPTSPDKAINRGGGGAASSSSAPGSRLGAIGRRPRHRAAGGRGPDNPRSAALRADPASASYPLHAAAYYGDVDALRRALHDAIAADKANGIDGEHPDSALAALDPCGNTALHVAVARRSRSALLTLLEDEFDFPLDARSSAGWTPLQEAVHMGSRTMCRQLFVKMMDRSKRQFDRKKPKLLATLASLPDFRMKIHWEFGSMVFGPIIRAYAPQDTYEITKRGTQLRIDGTLKGMEDPDENGGGILPRWRRGRFSLVFEGKAGDSRLLFLDHEKRECVDVGNEPEETTEEERDRIDNEVDVMMEEGPTKRKYRADDVNFKPVKAWLGGNKKEKVGEWNTEVYEASGKMAKRKVTRNGAYKVNGTFSEYLASFKEGAADIIVDRRVNNLDEAESDESDDADDAKTREKNDDEGAVDDEGAGVGKPPDPSPERPTTAGPGSTRQRPKRPPAPPPPAPPPLTAKQKWKMERARKKKEGKDEKPRRVTARCWLADEFPMSVDDLLPILDVMSHANKHLNKANRLIQYWRKDHGASFPVKVLVPIAMTVYVVMRFKDFARLPATDDGLSGLPPGHFDIPAGFVLKSLDQALKEAEEEEKARAKAKAERERSKRTDKRSSSRLKADDDGDSFD